jgi:hypothetical protein
MGVDAENGDVEGVEDRGLCLIFHNEAICCIISSWRVLWMAIYVQVAVLVMLLG